MLSELIEKHPNLPDVWGEGALFAFSGMDGETCAASGFVATYAAEPLGLLIHTPTRRSVSFRFEGEGRTRIATGDVYAAETPSGDLLQTFASWHTLVGAMPRGGVCLLQTEDGAEAELPACSSSSSTPETRSRPPRARARVLATRRTTFAARSTASATTTGPRR